MNSSFLGASTAIAVLEDDFWLPIGATSDQTTLSPFVKSAELTPAMAAGVTDRLWSISDMLAVLEGWEAKQQEAA